MTRLVDRRVGVIRRSSIKLLAEQLTARVRLKQINVAIAIKRKMSN
jgi:hypothetical protein